MMKYFVSISVCLLILIIEGCLISETSEYTLTLNVDGKSGTLVVIRRNMQSDATERTQQEKDFNELVQNWRGDQYLLDQMNKGTYVKERKVMVERGKVVWKETSIFSDISKLFPDINPNDTVRVPFKNEDGTVISTNGTILHEKDKTVVVWLPHTTEFIVKTQTKAFHTTSDFVRMFKTYQKRQ
jgi:hypothetical protein